MAQPLFDQHPLQEYFRHTGETAEPMPGSSPDFAPEVDDSLDSDDSTPQPDLQLPSFIVAAVQIVHDLLQSSASPHENSFAERFKYDVISSSLLSSALAAAPTSAVRRTFTPEIPGKLDDGGGGEDEHLTPGSALHPSSPLLGTQLPVVLLSFSVVVLSTGYIFVAMIPLAAAVYTKYVIQADADKNHSTVQTLDALNELISSGNVWDSAVQEAIALIENEERSIFYGPTSPQAPSSSLRIALQSSLHTTQTQCDNVRQLLSALTDPTLLSQLTEMYAPPSPVRPVLALPDDRRSPSSTMRPFSHPSVSRQRTSSLPNSQADKRATWNGSYAALAVAGSPTAHLQNRKKQNRRSDVMSLFQPMGAGPGQLASFSAPVSPQPTSPRPERLAVLEEEQSVEDIEELEPKSYFGAAALDLQRKRRSAGLEVLNAPPPNYTPPRSPLRGGFAHPQSTPMQPISLLTSTITSSSRLTTVHTTRHPLSLSGLHLALQGALSSKRYACSHLLALRFSEDEDDAYWENVRSVMALLTSTFADASARLTEALDDAEKRRIKDEHPTPPGSRNPTPSQDKERESSMSPLRNVFGPIPTRSLAQMLMDSRAGSGSSSSSFAPMPSSMARFAGHVDAISTALDDARSHIEACVAALRDAHAPPTVSAPSEVQEHPAFQAYDRLRKELGFALRECERGRERLLDIVAPPRSADDAEEEHDLSPHTPGLHHDSCSESSERGPVSPSHGHGPHTLGLTLAFGREEDEDDEDDEARTPLLMRAESQHLPEQVFEAETGAGAPFARARSALSREERIKLVKARRASGIPVAAASLIREEEEGDEEPAREKEKWGPGGEVVQELKDVIWKVGEKRRRMSEQVERAREDAGEPVVAPQPQRLPPPPLASLPEPERETSILIAVEEESPMEEEDDEGDDSGLAYLDSDSPIASPMRPSYDEAIASLDAQIRAAVASQSERTPVSDDGSDVS